MTAAPAFLLLAASAASAATIHVPGDQPTIQAGIDAARDSDEVVLANGVYRGEGNRNIDFSGKAITIRSASGEPEACVIDCEGEPASFDTRPGFRFETGEGPNSVLEGVTVTRGWWDLGGAVASFGSSPTIRGCIFRDNAAWEGGAVNCQWSGALIEDCLIVNNYATAFPGGGIFVVDSDIVVRRCTISYNEAGVEPGGERDGGGIAVHAQSFATSSVIVENCIISHSTRGEGISRDERSTATISCTDIFGNAGGDWVGSIAGQAGQSGNISADPVFCVAGNGDFTLSGESPCLPGNHPDGVDCRLIGAFGRGCGSVQVRQMLPAPNPFSSRTTLTFHVPTMSLARVAVYDVTGRLVNLVLDRELREGGHSVSWNARDQQGRRVAPGTYFVRLQAGGETMTRKVVFLGD